MLSSRSNTILPPMRCLLSSHRFANDNVKSSYLSDDEHKTQTNQSHSGHRKENSVTVFHLLFIFFSLSLQKIISISYFDLRETEDDLRSDSPLHRCRPFSAQSPRVSFCHSAVVQDSERANERADERAAH